MELKRNWKFCVGCTLRIPLFFHVMSAPAFIANVLVCIFVIEAVPKITIFPGSGIFSTVVTKATGGEKV